MIVHVHVGAKHKAKKRWHQNEEQATRLEGEGDHRQSVQNTSYGGLGFGLAQRLRPSCCYESPSISACICRCFLAPTCSKTVSSPPVPANSDHATWTWANYSEPLPLRHEGHPPKINLESTHPCTPWVCRLCIGKHLWGLARIFRTACAPTDGNFSRGK